MTTEERDAKVAELTQQSEAIKSQMQSNTDAARKLNEDNRTLIKKRRDIDHALNALRHVKVDDGGE